MFLKYEIFIKVVYVKIRLILFIFKFMSFLIFEKEYTDAT